MCLAVPGQIEKIIGENPLGKMARVNFGGVIKEISLAYVPEAQTGDYVIVHAGFAISVVDEREAQETLEYFKEINPSSENIARYLYDTIGRTLNKGNISVSRITAWESDSACATYSV